MSLQQQVEYIVQNTIEGTQALRNSRAAKAMAELIVRDLFATDNWEVINDYLNHRVSEELPPMDASGKLL